jgi:hypothetical protein
MNSYLKVYVKFLNNIFNIGRGGFQSQIAFDTGNTKPVRITTFSSLDSNEFKCIQKTDRTGR